MSTPARDIEVEITYLLTEKGGRCSPVPVDWSYRPQFHYDGCDYIAAHQYPDTDRVMPGETARAFLCFLSPELHRGRIRPGMRFLIREGAKTVAHGKVIQLLELENGEDQ